MNWQFERSPARRRHLAAAAALLTMATLLAYAGAPPPVSFTILAAGAAVLWTLSAETNVLGYLATLAFQVFQSLAIFRVAVSDFFMVPAAVKTYLSARRSGERWPQSTLWRPFALLLIVFVIGNVIGWLETGRPSGYVLVNKDLGILYLLAGFYTLAHYLSSREMVERAARWFVLGVSAANVTALIGVASAIAGLQNDLYLVGNLRLYGWMLNPSLFGGILLTAAMIELGLLASTSLDRRANAWRWINLWMMALSIALTISRGIWIAAAVGGSVLLMMHLAVQPTRAPATRLAAIAVWVLFPILALVSIVTANPGWLSLESPRAHAEDLQQRLVSQCRADPRLDLCASVQMPYATSGSSPALAPPATDAPTAPPKVVPEAGPIDNVMTNARGLQDRAAIIGVAGSEYLASVRRTLLGIGLGTFLASSAEHFGVPLIIHNTFAWFLFEMGPLGLVAVLWIWAVTARNLWRVCRSPDSAPLGVGLCAAFAGLTVFCILNEGFYQRHLWLVFALADRMFVLQAEGESRQVPAVAETVSPA